MGKMLTSSDFMTEQMYFNNKRKFINSIMFGTGVACGMSVFNLDDLSIMIESGVAIDGYGREIVIDKAVVKKLSSIDGFENLESDNVSLCVKYKEEAVHPVYAVNKNSSLQTERAEYSEGYEYNRISEGYELFLVDSNTVETVFEMDQEFLADTTLVSTDSYEAIIRIPTAASKGRAIKLILIVRKKDKSNKSFRMKCALQMPAFQTESGSHELWIETKEVQLFAGETIQMEYNLMAQDVVTEDTSIILKPETFEAYEDETEVEGKENIYMKLSVSALLPEELVIREAGKISLEMQNMAGVRDYIRLADFKLVRTGSAYLIESIDEKNVKSYIQAPSQAERRNEYIKYFTTNGIAKEKSDNTNSNISSYSNAISNGNSRAIATGVLEIPLGDRMRKGNIRYSGEIMHGLGAGNVYVKVGCEFMEQDRILDRMSRSTVYGNPNLFRDKALISNVETAVKVLNEKGSFIVAAKLLKDTEFVMLTMRWVAIRADMCENSGMLEEYSGKSISPEKTTTVLGLKESYYFNVRFHNMEPCGITYELTEPGSGEITTDGIYTAPAKEGVYEIKISCTDMPLICAYAYAVVRKTRN